MTTCLTTYSTGAHGDKSAKERVLTTFMYHKGLKGVEIPKKGNFCCQVVETVCSCIVTQKCVSVHKGAYVFISVINFPAKQSRLAG